MKIYHGSIEVVKTPEIRESNRTLDYGPVANDRVYAAFALYEGGLINKQILISELKTYKLVDQYLFHTEKSLQTIKFQEAKEIVL